MPIDAAVNNALNTHMGREFAAHFQYLAMSAGFEKEGLPGLAGLFAAQAAEEHGHAMRFLRFITDTGGPVGIPGQDAPIASFESVESVVAAALAQEEQVTRWIGDLVHLARERHEYATEIFLQWFVTEQVEEVASMTELLQVVRRAGPDGLLLVEEHVARMSPAADAGVGGAA